MSITALSTVESTPPNLSEEDDRNVIPFTPLPCSVDVMQHFTQELTIHHRDLIVYARSIVFDADQARDLVQEACLTAWKIFPSYDVAKADFGTLVRGILRNKIRDWVKSKKGGKRPEISINNDHLDFLETAFCSPEKKPSFSKLKQCVKKLPENLVKPIQQTYYKGQTNREASQKIGIRPATLRKRLSRARIVLHDYITQNNTLTNTKNNQ